VAVPQLPSIVLLVVGTVTGNDLLWIIAGGISLVVGVAALRGEDPGPPLRGPVPEGPSPRLRPVVRGPSAGPGRRSRRRRCGSSRAAVRSA
jgi:hypothetical protein